MTLECSYKNLISLVMNKQTLIFYIVVIKAEMALICQHWVVCLSQCYGVCLY